MTNNYTKEQILDRLGNCWVEARPDGDYLVWMNNQGAEDETYVGDGPHLSDIVAVAMGWEQ